MVEMVSEWFRRYFNDPEIVALFLLLAGVVLVFFAFGSVLMPIIASIILAYLLQWGVSGLQKFHVPRVLSVIIVYTIFLAIVCVSLFGLLPLLWHQLTALVNELPNTLGKAQNALMLLPHRYPDYLTPDQIQQLLDQFKLEFGRFGQWVLSTSLASIPSLVALIVYLVLVPMLVYFFLMDRQQIMLWVSGYLPKRRRLIRRVWQEVHAQIGNYVGGKFVEMLIVWIACYIVFWILGLQYAMLLSVLVGISVIIPYIGAVVVTVPVVAVGFLQWGWSSYFFYLIIAYGIIITLDANVLVPILFSEVVALHPVAIIIATLFFGKLWGFWGVFFAIPLATLVKAILNAVAKA